MSFKLKHTNHRNSLFWPLLFFCLINSGCATKYKKMKDEKGYGYRDEHLKNDVYKISFTGNSRMSEQKIYEFFMRRSAEVALEHHFQYFTVIEADDVTKYITVAAEAPMTKARIEAFPYAGSVYSPTMYKTIPRRELVGEIQLFKEGTQPKTAYSVEEILQKVKL